MPKEMYDAVASLCDKRAGTVSVNTWIVEAIAERLDREGYLQTGGKA
jgi:predicted HicB family RNase H-like nuclease